jgi:beta-glucosidase
MNHPYPLFKSVANAYSLATLAILSTATSITATAAETWRDTNLTPAERAQALLDVMSVDDKATLVLAADDHELLPLAKYGIPLLRRVDASAGLRGDHNVTAFPVPIALGATFNPELAHDYGEVIGKEARMKNWNIILGPTVDLARNPLFGRITESYGEDPILAGRMGAEVSKGMQASNLIVMAKHFNIYHQELDRLEVVVNLSDRALHELYGLPFEDLMLDAGINSLMLSYPKVNGTWAVENSHLIGIAKSYPEFQGYLATDFGAGALLAKGQLGNLVAQFNAGTDSWSLQPGPKPHEPFKDGTISEERLNDAAFRMLYAIFDDGLFDHALPERVAAVATNEEHQAVALKAAIQSIVLMKNEENILPLSNDSTVALIGPSSIDMITGVQGSTYVRPGAYTTPVEAISKAASKPCDVVVSQGTQGDAKISPLTSTPSFFGPSLGLKTQAGSPGMDASYYANATLEGEPFKTEAVDRIVIEGKPDPAVEGPWSAKWTATLTPNSTGRVLFTAVAAGSVKLTIGDDTVIDDTRPAGSFFPGDGGHYFYPMSNSIELEAGKTYNFVVEFTPEGAAWAPSIEIGCQPASMIPQAVEAAKTSEVAIVFVNQATGEEMDRSDLGLPADQDELIEAVAAANPNTIVVLNTPGAVVMPWLEKVQGVLQLWYPGSQGGNALAKVIYGEVDAQGRLPVTFPANMDQGPSHYDGSMEITYDEGVNIGYKYLLKHEQKPLFPFGYGLSYTSFDYSDLSVSDEEQSVTITVKNTGDRKGSTIVQVYAGELPTTEVETPLKKLAAFQKVCLDAGASKTVTLPLDARVFNYWDESSNRWKTPAGDVEIFVGTSVEDISLTDSISIP